MIKGNAVHLSVLDTAQEIAQILNSQDTPLCAKASSLAVLQNLRGYLFMDCQKTASFTEEQHRSKFTKASIRTLWEPFIS
jgi:hypothetical protein